MRFISFVTISLTALATGVVALPFMSSITTGIQARTLNIIPNENLVPTLPFGRRGGCSTCGTSGSGSTGSTSSTSIDTSIDISSFNTVQLNYINSCIQALLSLDVKVDAVIKTKLIATTIILTSWSASQLDDLEVAFVAFLKWKTLGAIGLLGLDVKTKNILALARLDVVSLTKLEIDCLRIFISTVIKTNVDLTVEAKASLLNWCGAFVGYTYVKLEDIKAIIYAAIHASVDTTASAVVTTSATVDTTLVATHKIKVALKAYIEGLVTKASILVVVQLKAALYLVDAWVKGDLDLLSKLGVKVVTDLAVCTSVVATLKTCGVDAVTVLGLDLSVLSKTKLVL